MRGHVLVLILAPAALAGLLSPPPHATAQEGCTPCQCGAAMCIGPSMFWYVVNVTALPDTVLVGEVFQIEARLSLQAGNASEGAANVTSGPMQLFVTYQYVDPENGRAVEKSASALVADNATYPGNYSIPFVLAAPGVVDIEVWTHGGHSQKERLMILEAPVSLERIPEDAAVAAEDPARDATPVPLMAAVFAAGVAALIARRRW